MAARASGENPRLVYSPWEPQGAAPSPRSARISVADRAFRFSGAKPVCRALAHQKAREPPGLLRGDAGDHWAVFLKDGVFFADTALLSAVLRFLGSIISGAIGVEDDGLFRPRSSFGSPFAFAAGAFTEWIVFVAMVSGESALPREASAFAAPDLSIFFEPACVSPPIAEGLRARALALVGVAVFEACFFTADTTF